MMIAIGMHIGMAQGPATPAAPTLGPELLPSAPTSLDAASTWVDGTLSTTKAGSGTIAVWSGLAAFVIGKSYRVQYTVVSTNGNVLVPRLSNNAGSSAPATTTVGTFNADVVAVAITGQFAFNLGGSGVTAVINGISLREVL